MLNTFLKEDILKLAPTTRYQGSKRKILRWIYENIRHLRFRTVLDGFGGTGSVSYLFKLMGKQVTFNDLLQANYETGVAIIENNAIRLEEEDINFIISRNGFKYPCFIQKTFKDIYFLDSENEWLDTVVFNVQQLSEKYRGDLLNKKKALAHYALFQACLCKRPFNLFHRNNLYLRTARVKRSFGNKKTWNTKFSKLFIKFCDEISNKVFSNNERNRAMCKDVMDIENTNFDLVYFDPPYRRPDEKLPRDYYYLYHFLEGLMDYDNWWKKINWDTKNRSLTKKKTRWEENPLEENFDFLFNRFKESTIVVSYGDPGYPSIGTIENLLRRYKSNVRSIKTPYSYKLNHKNGNGLYEVLIIGE